jgi:hypothetical protein
MAQLQAHGLGVDAPSGWEGRIFQRAEEGEVNVEVSGAAAPPGERSFPVVHVATIPLPLDMADYGSDVVEDLRRDDALIVLKEFDPAGVDQPLFAKEGMRRKLKPEHFDPAVLQRRLDGQAGYQEFFHDAGRTFCIYVVLGSYDRRVAVVPRVNAVLATLTIDPLASEVPPEPETSSSTTTSTTTEGSTPEEPTTTPTEPPAEPPTEPPVESPTEPPATLPADPGAGS